MTSRKGERSHRKATPIAKPEAAATVTVALAELQRLRAFEQALTSPLALGMTSNMNDAASRQARPAARAGRVSGGELRAEEAHTGHHTWLTLCSLFACGFWFSVVC